MRLQHNDSPFHCDRQVSQNTSSGAMKIGLVVVFRVSGHPIRLSPRLRVGIHEGVGAAGAITDIRHFTVYHGQRYSCTERFVRHTGRNMRCNETDSPVHGNYLKAFPTALSIFRTGAVTIYVQYEQVTAQRMRLQSTLTQKVPKNQPMSNHLSRQTFVGHSTHTRTIANSIF